MEAHILLADAAQRSPEGKIHALGLGWSVTTTPLPPQAVVVFMKVPWDRATVPHSALLTLVDEDGRTVRPHGPESPPLAIQTDFETGRPPGLPAGMPLDMAVTFTIAPGLPLNPGGYVWRLEIDGESDDTWQAAFHVRAQDG